MSGSSTSTSGGSPPGANPTSGATVHPRWKVATVKMINWFAFGVLFSVMPIIGSYSIGKIRGTDRGLVQLIGHGELLIVATGLCAAAAGQAFTMKHTSFDILPRLLGCGNILIALFTAGLFAEVSAAMADSEPIKASVVISYSLWLFATALITSFSSALLAELEQ